MLKREFKINLKSFIIWTSISIILFLVSFLVYPSIVNSESSANLNEMLKMFPKEVLAMFNMDISNIDTVFGWFQTEGITLFLLLVCLFASILGSNILTKEESEKTIEFLYSKPISRNRIVTSKLLCGTIYILAIILVVTLFNLIGMYLSDSLEFKKFILLSLSISFTALPIFYLTVYISSYFNKIKKTIGIGLAVVFISFFIQMISMMGKKIEWFKYLSFHTLSDSRNIIKTAEMDYRFLIISMFLSLMFIILTYVKYNKKELV
ncbi:MAG: ABC transporter permease subunit [Bacilli bacterium]|nr:ABC transporter permease subunit [Bacilli bacterium]